MTPRVPSEPTRRPGEIVAGDALDGAGAGLDGLPRGREKLEAHDVIQGDAVFQPPQAPGIFRHVAPQGGHRHAPGVGGVKEPPGLHRLGQLGRDHPRLHHGVQVLFVDLQDLVEGIGEHHHAPRMGNGAAAEIGARAPHRQGQAVLVAQARHPAQEFRGLGPHHQCRQDRFQDRGVIGIGEAVGLLEKHLVLAQELLKFFYQAVADHIVLLPGVGTRLLLILNYFQTARNNW